MIVEYKKEGNKPIIYIFQYQDGKKVVERIVDFEPYFYVLENEFVGKFTQIKRVEKGDFVSLHGVKLKKIVVNLPEEVPQIREKFSKHFEADVVFTERFIIDKLKTIRYEKLRVQYLDIETDDSHDVELADKPITVIGVYDSFLKKYVIFCWRKDFKIHEKKEDGVSIYYYNDEVDMIKSYLNFIRDTNPDLITGWYLEQFDMKYMIKRMGNLKIDYKQFSQIGEVIVRDKDVFVKGRIIFDLIDGYKYLKDTEIESRRLDDVGKLELNLQKVKFEGTPGELWRNDFDKLIKYNIRDIEILVRLDDKMKILSFVDELRRLSNCSFKESLHMSLMFDSFLLSKYHGKFIFRSRVKNNQPFKFKGAIVVDPIKGLHKNVLHIDLKSLYPSIIISLNMSPETVNKNGEYDVGNGVKFKSEPEGIIPQLEKYLWELRDKKKQEKKDAYKKGDKKLTDVLDRQQYCIKVVMNAIYGQTSFPKSRIFTPQIAESITFIGRKILTATIKKLEEWKHEVIYGDTDGLFLKIKEGTNPVELVKELNIYYGEFCKQFKITKHVFDIEYEKIYKSFIIHSKKRYAGILKIKGGNVVDEFEVKGLEMRRTDNSKFVRKLQKEVLVMILSGKTKVEIKNFLNSEMKKIQMSSYEDIAIPRGLTQELKKYKTTSPWIRGCNYSKQNLKIDFSKGDKVKLVYIKQMPKNFPHTSELCFFSDYEIPKGVEIDWNKMVEKSIVKKLERIFEAIGWNSEEMFGRNKSLMDF